MLLKYYAMTKSSFLLERIIITIIALLVSLIAAQAQNINEKGTGAKDIIFMSSIEEQEEEVVKISISKATEVILNRGAQYVEYTTQPNTESPVSEIAFMEEEEDIIHSDASTGTIDIDEDMITPLLDQALENIPNEDENPENSYLRVR
jgi:hypothetical protein